MTPPPMDPTPDRLIELVTAEHRRRVRRHRRAVLAAVALGVLYVAFLTAYLLATL